ncbi:MAG TPA: DNA alkylation repair protein [Vicinamibacterales bacterium]|jgi:3-methyladenine DNA glycosylase AlkD|nr:DNA alkylation repair protein [Vicinamibacterales bacterium]
MARSTSSLRRSVGRALRRLSRPAGSFDAARYFRGGHDLRFYNVGTAAMRAFARDQYQTHRDVWTIDDAMREADALMLDPYLETKSVAIELVARYRRSFAPRLLTQWKRWLAGNLSANWATTDAICGMLIGPLLVDRPELARQMTAWSRDSNMWVRRASAVALIPLLRRGLALDLGYATAARLQRDREDLIQKAVGWMLREAGKTDSRRLERYLLAQGPRTPRTTLRYAIERFPAARRRAILTRTRAIHAPLNGRDSAAR